jgi:hypothetical protein
MTKTLALASLLLALLYCLPTRAEDGARQATVWKSPTCGCCSGWVDYLKHNGYRVQVVEVDDVDPVKQRLGVPQTMQSCHTASIDGYVVEGHVPVEAIDMLLKQRPKVTGIAAPGMPSGSPGMPGPKEPNVIHAFSPKENYVIGRY